jgi:EAL domain-containing protein (putative c-di-GMP-specific phosphodiesterase class I)
VFVTASIGLSFNISQNRNALEILSEAQTSLSHAIGLGGNRFCFFEVGMDTASKARKSLEIELRRDVAAEALQMVYQPQINAKGIMTGVEALMRWTRPGQDQVSPSVFVPLAEHCGLSSALGLFALKQAFSDSRRWPELTVAVNVSALQIRDELVQTLKTLLLQTGANPHQIEIEITEGVLLNEQPETKQTLDNIRKLGFTIALDDFGTGYSSLSYLRRFPIDKIKIDQSFVAQLGKQPESSAIIKAIIEMGAALDLKIIAEGVETAAQAQSLSMLGCSLYQGYLFSRPVEAGAVDVLMLKPAKVAA